MGKLVHIRGLSQQSDTVQLFSLTLSLPAGSSIPLQAEHRASVGTCLQSDYHPYHVLL